MKTKPLTRLPVTLMLMGVTLAVVAIGWVAFGASMFSPGKLNARRKAGVVLNGVHSHAELSNNCAACHAAPWKSETMGSRCQDCHSDIRSQIAGKEPLHGRLTSGQDCRKCHTEHQGALAELTSFANFNHAATAFKLTGRHQTVACEQCHTNQTYQGTPQSCVGCHADPPVHKGRFGLACADCHTTATWKGVTFNHDLAAFKLTGKHQTVACAQCHINETYKGTPQACVSCHADPAVHKGRFGLACADCHSTATWKGATFSHVFPLNHGGAQKKNLGCVICHATAGDYKAYTCYGCHKHQPEKTLEKHARMAIAHIENCAACHGTGREKEGKKKPPGERKKDD